MGLYNFYFCSLLQPFLLGKAMLPLKLCLTANQLRSSFVLDVKASSQGTAVKETTRKEPVTSREEPVSSSQGRACLLQGRAHHWKFGGLHAQLLYYYY